MALQGLEMATRRDGFTLMEMMAVIAIICILALIAAPSYLDQMIRKQIVDAVPLAEIAKTPIAAAWSVAQSFPRDNAAAGLPAADKIVNNFISSLSVQDGAIHIVFGNSANALIKGKILSIRAAVVDDAPIVPVAWVCGNAEGPGKMTIKGENKTSVPASYLPRNCRAPGS
jgi:type IV pilus assembly protein PilA